MKLHISVILCMILLFVLFSSQVSAVALGINKARIDFDDVLRDGYAEESFIVSTDSPEMITGVIEVEGDIADWVTFRPETVTTDGFEFSADSPMRIVAIIQPPADAANDEYEGIIRVLTGEIARGGDGQYGTSARAAFKLVTRIGVTGIERLHCTLGGSSLMSTEIDQPSDLRYSIKNDGNVRVQPTINIEIYDQERKKTIDRFDIETQSTILPTTSDSFITQVRHTLPIGQYWAQITSEECDGSSLVTFDVLERGGIADQGEFVRLEAEPWADVGDIIPITGVFRNTGSRTVSAKMKGTIALGRKVVKEIDTDFYDTPPQQIARIETFFNPSKPGQYEVKAQVLYNNKLTYERTTYINVSGEALQKSSTINWIVIIIIIIILLLLLIIRRKRRRRYR